MAAPPFASRLSREKPSGLALPQGVGQTVPLPRASSPLLSPLLGRAAPGQGESAVGLALSPFPGAERGPGLGAASEHRVRVRVFTGHGPCLPRERPAPRAPGRDALRYCP
ncbi:hypothetical protein Nmel_010765 [Mimus melanotis]